MGEKNDNSVTNHTTPKSPKGDLIQKCKILSLAVKPPLGGLGVVF